MTSAAIPKLLTSSASSLANPWIVPEKKNNRRSGCVHLAKKKYKNINYEIYLGFTMYVFIDFYYLN